MVKNTDYWTEFWLQIWTLLHTMFCHLETTIYLASLCICLSSVKSRKSISGYQNPNTECMRSNKMANSWAIVYNCWCCFCYYISQQKKKAMTYATIILNFSDIKRNISFLIPAVLQWAAKIYASEFFMTLLIAQPPSWMSWFVCLEKNSVEPWLNILELQFWKIHITFVHNVFTV